VLARRWAAAGRRLVLGVRDPADADVQALARETGAAVAEPRAAAAEADVVVIALPWKAVEEVVTGLGDLSGKVLVDCSNPIGPGWTLEVGHTTSAAEMVAGWAPGARVVKAFSTTGAGNMLDPSYGDGGTRLAMFICGDDADAKSRVSELVADLGFDPIDNGPLRQARFLEPFAMVWITQAYQQGWGPNFGIAVLRR